VAEEVGAGGASSRLDVMEGALVNVGVLPVTGRAESIVSAMTGGVGISSRRGIAGATTVFIIGGLARLPGATEDAWGLGAAIRWSTSPEDELPDISGITTDGSRTELPDAVTTSLGSSSASDSTSAPINGSAICGRF